MLRLLFTDRGKGFVFTLDAVLAIVIVGTLFAFVGYSVYGGVDSSVSSRNLSQAADDSFSALGNSGFILQALDSLGMSQEAADSIRERALGLLPQGAEARLRLREYDVNMARCKEDGTFSSCFPAEDMAESISGPGLPAGIQEVVHSRKVFVKKQGPGECTKEVGELSAPLKQRLPAVYFDEAVIWLAEDDNEVNFDLNVRVSPGEEIECGDNLVIDINASAPSQGREPVDIMLVIDRSGSMGECSIADGNTISQYSGTTKGSITDQNTGTLGGSSRNCTFWFFICWDWEYTGWEWIHGFDIDDENAFSVRMEWEGGCGSGGCPEMYIESPASEQYGFYGGDPPGGDYTSTTGYNLVSVPKSASENGTWDVYGWNDSPDTDYNLAVSFPSWELAQTFTISDENAFDVLVSWTNCSSGCPQMYVEGPGGQRYGYLGGAPNDGCFVETGDSTYLAVPSSLSENGVWEVWVWGETLGVDYTSTVKEIAYPVSKIESVKAAAIEFVNYEDWSDDNPVDQIGLVSYATSSNPEKQLLVASDTNKGVIESEINGLSSGGNTATGDGIQEATDELASSRGNPDAFQFQVLLSDGQTNTGMSSTTAANNAADENIVIYTIGFGPDADEEELANIAGLTDGNYYAANDENALKAVYELIAQDIGDRAAKMARDATLYVPVGEGITVIDDGGGVEDEGYLAFEMGDLNSSGWATQYTIRLDCEDPNCDVNRVVVPGEGTYIEYNGDVIKVWDENVVLDLLYRDLNVVINSGRIYGEGLVYLDVNAANIGFLDTGPTVVNFYLGDPDLNGELIASVDVPGFCGARGEESCGFYFRLYNKNAGEEGTIYALINPDNEIDECSGNNKDRILCQGLPKTQYYMLDYWVWYE